MLKDFLVLHYGISSAIGIFIAVVLLVTFALIRIASRESRREEHRDMMPNEP